MGVTVEQLRQMTPEGYNLAAVFEPWEDATDLEHFVAIAIPVLAQASGLLGVLRGLEVRIPALYESVAASPNHEKQITHVVFTRDALGCDQAVMRWYRFRVLPGTKDDHDCVGMRR